MFWKKYSLTEELKQHFFECWGTSLQRNQFFLWQYSPCHCEKTVQIRGFSGLRFPALGLLNSNTGKYEPEKLWVCSEKLYVMKSTERLVWIKSQRLYFPNFNVIIDNQVLRTVNHIKHVSKTNPCSVMHRKNVWLPAKQWGFQLRLRIVGKWKWCVKKEWKYWQNIYWVKSVQMRIISGPYFPVFGLNTAIFSVNLRLQTEYRKIKTRNNFVFGHFSK